ncbi:MAG: chromate transporter [Treponema sp.]|jgi:chromate transporter|nr:chromate transporter [Treponema sp.]
MNLLLLYAEFVKIGLFSFGGGLATLPFLYNMAERYDWLKPEDIGNCLAIAQSSPGAIGVNTCTQIGYLAAGIPGAIIAPLGLISPAIIVIVIVARILTAFKENTVVNAVFEGLRPAALGLISSAGFAVTALSLYSMDSRNRAGIWYGGFQWKEVILFAILYGLIWKLKKHPMVYVALAGIAGVILGL